MRYQYIIFVMAVSSLGLLIAPPTLAELNDGLVAYYPFNGNAQDMSGNGNHGTVNGATLTTDRFGKANNAYYFDGITNRIEIPLIFNNDQDPLTFSAWVLQEEVMEGTCPTIFGEFTKWEGSTRNFFCLHGNDGGKLSFDQSGPSGGGAQIKAGTANNEGQWIHIAIIKDNNMVFGYKNGVLMGSVPHTETYSGRAVTFGAIGARPIDGQWNYYNGAYNFKGEIDELRIYNRALSEDEIQTLYDMVSDGDDSNVTDDNTNIPDANTPNVFTSIPMELTNWNKEQCGFWEETAEGLKIYGSGSRRGNMLYSKSLYNFTDSETFIKWKPNGNRTYMWVSPGISRVIGAGNGKASFTTGWSFMGSPVAVHDTWYYSRFKINPDKIYTIVTSTGDYDINGGHVVTNFSQTIADKYWPFIENGFINIGFGDNYGSTGAFVVVSEVTTNALENPMGIVASSYDFEEGIIPPDLSQIGNWTIDNSGFDSDKSLYINGGKTNNKITLEVSDAIAVSFDLKDIANYNIGFFIDGISRGDFDATTNACWNQFKIPIPMTGTHTLEWRVTDNSPSIWIDNIKVYRKSDKETTPIVCQLYAVQDNGLNDSQLFTINPDTLEVNALGQNLPGYDIEALDIHPNTGALYAASGDNTDNPGHLYTVNLQTGALTDLGSTGFVEIEDLTFDLNGTLWAWAKGNGLISIDLQKGITGTLIIPSTVGIEGLTWNSDGTLLYAAQGRTLWVSDGKTVEKACDLPGPTEALEMLPDNQLLLGIHGNKKILDFKVMDLSTCDLVPGVGIPTDYDDVEGIAWPAKGCAD